jgi:hypothetical protein
VLRDHATTQRAQLDRQRTVAKGLSCFHQRVSFILSPGTSRIGGIGPCQHSLADVPDGAPARCLVGGGCRQKKSGE